MTRASKPPARRVAEPLRCACGCGRLAVPRSLVEKACEAMEGGLSIANAAFNEGLLVQANKRREDFTGVTAAQYRKAYEATEAALRTVLAELRGYVGGRS